MMVFFEFEILFCFVFVIIVAFFFSFGGNGGITKVSTDQRKGSYIFAWRVSTLVHTFTLLLIGSAKPSAESIIPFSLV